MNIYVTGMNPADAGALKRAPRVALFQAFVEMMELVRDDGNTLTWRATKVGDPLPANTDAVIASVMLPRSLNCPYALGVMWTIYQAVTNHVPLVLYLTDWAFFKATSEFRSIAKAGPDYFSKLIGGQLQYNEDPRMIVEHGEKLIEMCRWWGNSKSQMWENAEILVPRYTNWGSVDIIQTFLPGGNPVLTMDPTPLLLQYLDVDRTIKVRWSMDLRDRSWLLPSLLKDDTWILKQGFTWPVERFGPKGFSVLPTERHILVEYSRHVGALCPPYPTGGSGWWRSRWIHSALAESVLFCGSLDAYEVGQPYINAAYALESMSNEQLQQVAKQQSELMRSKLQTEMDVLRGQIQTAFKKAGV